MCAWGGGEGQASGFTFLNSVLPLEIQPSRTPGAKRSRSDLLEQVRCPSKVCRPGEQTLQFPRKIGRRVASRYGTCNNRSVFGPPPPKKRTDRNTNGVSPLTPPHRAAAARSICRAGGSRGRRRACQPAGLRAAVENGHFSPPAPCAQSCGRARGAGRVSSLHACTSVEGSSTPADESMPLLAGSPSSTLGGSRRSWPMP